MSNTNRAAKAAARQGRTFAEKLFESFLEDGMRGPNWNWDEMADHAGELAWCQVWVEGDYSKEQQREHQDIARKAAQAKWRALVEEQKPGK
ncbi:hypothetical protein HNP46_006365 [Pseudomonas nitritireducens]|uniref:Uncharacterized protein n=1 Tax=Pseudomonas nitroreducens TaxID=46680 RepID=A0A7W7KRC3_PSENT|nr:hypothetical protein [Pseudomonas nitritireducens]MBB4867452.1 hypothetical protein [Pseudomonas nitritireducens]